nr:MAG TPA: hypothetical protein [Caudoviricetes sp.]
MLFVMLFCCLNSLFFRRFLDIWLRKLCPRSRLERECLPIGVHLFLSLLNEG